MRIGTHILGLLAAFSWGGAVMAQPKMELEIKKPKQFEERKLGSEKMAEKKFTVPRHFFQNMYTHYNYYFNASHRLNEIIDGAKLQHKEDYTQLLPFYNYSLDATSKSSEIDSVLQKCTAGILLHDLRNDWIDNLYLLIGRAYLLRKDYDSASMSFQYINYAYSPKEKDGYDKVIGSNSNEGGSALSISTKEKTNIYKKVIELPPSRNESFIWQIRTFTEREEFIDASSLITTLRNDPLFPSRLKEELSEVEGYNYYQQGIYDSSAKYLAKAVKLAQNSTEKARWYYLLGQMYQLTGQLQAASDYFAKCASTTIDPVMEVYARVASVRLRKNDDPKVVDQNIAEILKMAKKEKYELYRDIVYYAAALMELERKGYAKAEDYLQKSLKYNTDNAQQKNTSFLLLADIAFTQKEYGKAGNLYDSVNTSTVDSLTAKIVAERKPGCKTIYDKERIIFIQDSLLKIASMPENDRNLYVRSLARRLRKARGLKDLIDSSNTGLALNSTQIGQGASNLFDDGKGDFYFYNSIQKSNGFQQFKQKWGARPNVDNWRRSASLQVGVPDRSGSPKTDLASASVDPGTTGSATAPVDINSLYNPADLSFDALSTNLPVEKAAADAANTSIDAAMLEKAKALQNQVEDIPEAIKVYEALLARKSAGSLAEEVMFNLVYCYNRIGDKATAATLKSRLNNQFKDGAFTKKMNAPVAGDEKSNPAANAKYKEIYNLFIEGNFEQAVLEKQKADAAFGPNYWSPQLLYIESVYYIKQRQDSAAIQKLTILASAYSSSPLAARAKTLIDVLSRRKEIEGYLNGLTVVRQKEDGPVMIPAVSTAPPPPRSPVTNTTIPTTAKKDSTGIATQPAVLSPVNTNPAFITPPKRDSAVQQVITKQTGFVVDTTLPQMVMIVLNKVDIVYLNECLNAFSRYNQQNIRGQVFELQKLKLDPVYGIVTINSPDFVTAAKAMEYIARVKPKAATGIVPWLDAAKYSFAIINQANLELLKQNTDMKTYLEILKKVLPGRF